MVDAEARAAPDNDREEAGRDRRPQQAQGGRAPGDHERGEAGPDAHGPDPDQRRAAVLGLHLRHRRGEPDRIEVADAHGHSQVSGVWLDGEVVEALPNAMFRVKLDNDHEVIAYAAGKMRKFYIRILLGDRIKVEVSPYDLQRGRITYRYK